MQNYQNHPLAGARDLDSAMIRLWAFYKKYFIGMYIISVISALISNLITSTLDTNALMQATGDPELLVSTIKEMALPYSVIMAVSFVFTVILHAWVLGKPLDENYGVVSTLKDSAVAFFPFLLAAIVMGLGGVMLIGIGFVMLVLPGLFAMFYFITVFIFALPLALAETRNTATIIGRSFKLAHKNLWPNMGWVVVVALIMLIASMIVSGIIILPFTGTFVKSLANPEEASALLEMSKSPLYIILSSLAGGLITPVFPILAFILYFRNSEEIPQAVIEKADDGRVKVEDLYPKMPDRE
ncbi:MAG TPA: hypothetical protein VLQ76_03875 [Bacteroidales bacterium]|nr:hypothetical protein [Bacteroidales bacterium]